RSHPPHVLQTDATEPRDRPPPGVAADLEPVEREPVTHPVGGGERTGTAWRAGREGLTELQRIRIGRRSIEVRRQRGCRQRGRARAAEREDDQREGDEEERAAVEAAVDGPLERAAPRPPPRRAGGGGCHAGLQ